MAPLGVGSSSVRATGLETTGWSAVWIAFGTILPWTVVAVFDAIDWRYRRIRTVIFRLILSTCCNAIAYVIGLWFVVEIVLAVNIRNRTNGCQSDATKCEYERFDEIATFLVLLFFNFWFVFRNIRGWLQLFSLFRLRPFFNKMQKKFALASLEPIEEPLNRRFGSYPVVGSESDNVREGDNEHPMDQIHEDGISLMRVSDRLINNDLETSTPFLNPFIIRGKNWSIATWRAWWTQEFKGRVTLDAPEHYNWIPDLSIAQDLPHMHPYAGPCWQEHDRQPVRDPTTGRIIEKNDIKAWKSALGAYGSGQQDVIGKPHKYLFSYRNRTGIATLIHEVTHILPHRMTSLWYDTERFESAYEEVASEMNTHNVDSIFNFPKSFGWWKELALDIARNLKEPAYLSGDALTNYAGKIASASILITKYSEEYKDLVEIIYRDGRNSRWMFGWSGLLSCYSNLWTRQRIFMAMLNGLSLLAIQSSNSVREEEIDVNVRSLMVGYASFFISNRAIGKRIASIKKEELLKRYSKNLENKCRNVGLKTIRDACEVLKIPAEASHMDGLPSFSIGWTREYIGGKSGTHFPTEGVSHTEIENMLGSSNTWRYPDSKL